MTGEENSSPDLAAEELPWWHRDHDMPRVTQGPCGSAGTVPRSMGAELLLSGLTLSPGSRTAPKVTAEQTFLKNWRQPRTGQDANVPENKQTPAWAAGNPGIHSRRHGGDRPICPSPQSCSSCSCNIWSCCCPHGFKSLQGQPLQPFPWRNFPKIHPGGFEAISSRAGNGGTGTPRCFCVHQGQLYHSVLEMNFGLRLKAVFSWGSAQKV